MALGWPQSLYIKFTSWFDTHDAKGLNFPNDTQTSKLAYLGWYNRIIGNNNYFDTVLRAMAID